MRYDNSVHFLQLLQLNFIDFYTCTKHFNRSTGSLATHSEHLSNDIFYRSADFVFNAQFLPSISSSCRETNGGMSFVTWDFTPSRFNGSAWSRFKNRRSKNSYDAARTPTRLRTCNYSGATATYTHQTARRNWRTKPENVHGTHRVRNPAVIKRKCKNTQRFVIGNVVIAHNNRNSYKALIVLTEVSWNTFSCMSKKCYFGEQKITRASAKQRKTRWGESGAFNRYAR